jgi:hypothetical protein
MALNAFGGGSGPGAIVLGNSVAVTAPAAGYTTVADIGNLNSSILCFQFTVAAQALDQFQILGRAHGSAPFVTIGVSGNSWTDKAAANSNIAIGSRILETNGNLDAVGAGSNGYFAMDISGLVEIQVQVSAAVNGAVITPYWSMQ